MLWCSYSRLRRPKSNTMVLARTADLLLLFRLQTDAFSTQHQLQGDLNVFPKAHSKKRAKKEQLWWAETSKGEPFSSRGEN